jgi:hypothetical protein
VNPNFLFMWHRQFGVDGSLREAEIASKAGGAHLSAADSRALWLHTFGPPPPRGRLRSFN